jgi:hypothetical protein
MEISKQQQENFEIRNALALISREIRDLENEANYKRKQIRLEKERLERLSN